MSYSEIAFLGTVLLAFGAFIGCIGFISIWSGRPAKRSHSTSAVVTPAPTGPTIRKAA